jgi:hypothetical protein
MDHAWLNLETSGYGKPNRLRGSLRIPLIHMISRYISCRLPLESKLIEGDSDVGTYLNGHNGISIGPKA